MGMKTLTVADPVLGMPAYDVTIPADWTFQGAVLRAATGDQMLVFRATRPHGMVGVQRMPDVVSVWAETPQEQAFFRAARLLVQRPQSPVEFLKTSLIPAARPGAVAGQVSPLPNAAELQRNMAELNARAAASGSSIRSRGEGAMMRITYEYEGHPMEEDLAASVITMDVPTRMGVYQSTHTYSAAMRAPRGQLDAQAPLLLAILRSPSQHPAWVRRFAEQQRHDARVASATIAQFTQQNMASERAARQRNQQVFERSMSDARARQNAIDASARGTAEHMGDVQTMIDPATGRVGQVSNQYNHSFADQDGRVIHTNSPTFDPNAALRGTWTQLQPLKP